MKAIYLVRFGKPEEAFEMRDVAIPAPSDSQVRVKVEAFGLNYADVTGRQGMYRDCPPLPCVLGYDAVGRVEATGKNVKNVKAFRFRQHWQLNIALHTMPHANA